MARTPFQVEILSPEGEVFNDEVDRSAFESRLKEAQQAVERAEEGSEERARAEREVKRYEAFLALAEGRG